MEAHEFSKRLGAISPAQFQAALDHFGLGRLVSAEPITLGNFGQNCFLHSTAGRIRVARRPALSVAVPRGAVLCPTAARAHVRAGSVALLRERIGSDFRPGPTPSCLACRAGLWPTKRFAAAWTGPRNGRSPGHSDTRWPISRHWNGRCPAPTIQQPGRSGNPAPSTRWLSTRPPLRPEWTRRHTCDSCWRRHEQQHRRRPPRPTLRGPNPSLPVRSMPWREPFRPCCVMRDYQENNVNVERAADGTWQVSGVFDLMGLFFGDGEAALSRQAAVYAERDCCARQRVRVVVSPAAAPAPRLHPAFSALHAGRTARGVGVGTPNGQSVVGLRPELAGVGTTRH